MSSFSRGLSQTTSATATVQDKLKIEQRSDKIIKYQSMWWNGRHACLRCMWRELWGFKSPRRHHKKELGQMSNSFLQISGIGFQDSCDWSFQAKLPNYWAIEGDLQCRDLPDYSCTFVLIFALFCTDIQLCRTCFSVYIAWNLNFCRVQNSALKCKNKLSFSLICVELSLILRFRT